MDLTKDKKYIIDFWFVGCAPCVQDHKLMAQKMALLKKSNVEVVGISIDQNQEVWKNYLKTKKYNWTNVREINDSEKRASRNMLIGNFPTYMLIDQKGNDWTMLVIPGFAVMAVAWTTIAAQSLGTMLKNPTESLRSE